MQDPLINGLETIKLEIQTLPGADGKGLERLTTKLDRSIEAAKDRKMVRALEILSEHG